MTTVTVLGAAGGIVTGSSYLVEGKQGKILIDFGAFQGKDGEGKNDHNKNNVDKANYIPNIHVWE